MDPGVFFETLRVRLVDHRVSAYRLACDSLLVYFDCEPGDETGVTLWFEPIWHFRGPQGVLVGSMQAFEAAQTEDGLDALSGLMDGLHEKEVEQVVVDPVSFDLSVSFAGGYSVTTFVADATAGESWRRSRWESASRPSIGLP